MEPADQIVFTLKARVNDREVTPATIAKGSSYDEAELEAAIAKGTKAWATVPDSVAWLNDIRGGDKVDLSETGQRPT